MLIVPLVCSALAFRCFLTDLDVVWVLFVLQGVMRWVEANNNKSADCYYLFELDHQAACMTSPTTGLSTGAVITIVYVQTINILADSLYWSLSAVSQRSLQLRTSCFVYLSHIVELKAYFFYSSFSLSRSATMTTFDGYIWQLVAWLMDSLFSLV
jgi:Mannose-6-phosphate receptor